MNRQTLKRLMVKGTMAYVAVFSLVLMMAMPALALIAANVNAGPKFPIIAGPKFPSLKVIHPLLLDS